MKKLNKNLAGIRNMKKLPDLIFIVDPKKKIFVCKKTYTWHTTNWYGRYKL